MIAATPGAIPPDQRSWGRERPFSISRSAGLGAPVRTVVSVATQRATAEGTSGCESVPDWLPRAVAALTLVSAMPTHAYASFGFDRADAHTAQLASSTGELYRVLEVANPS